MSQQKQLSDITITDYSEKSFVVRGETRPYKETIKTLGGKWNSNLKDGPGWIFPSVKKAEVKEWIDTGECSVISKPVEPFGRGGGQNLNISSLHEKIDRLTKLIEASEKQAAKVGLPKRVQLRQMKEKGENITIKVRGGVVVDISTPPGTGVTVDYLVDEECEDEECEEEDSEPELPPRGF